ncbi:hypothetical protein TUN199_11704 [Pyrenophora tritici-repentis]|nr:hypothetical protein Alg130_11809 [Pyrenophora tritici-repentis]KAI0604068.1 hypothetical protein TUN205_11685 [Pyrenophora tritici-repentis]KAI0616305.1 hypothetical protein TUN199_11704 [Pyrenophora tritici-repentis]
MKFKIITLMLCFTSQAMGACEQVRTCGPGTNFPDCQDGIYDYNRCNTPKGRESPDFCSSRVQKPGRRVCKSGFCNVGFCTVRCCD